MKVLLTVYLGVWIWALAAYWFFTGGSDAMGYSLLFLWLLLPATTFVVSFLTGKKDYWGKRKWFLVPAFGLMYMLAEYATFGASYMAYHRTFLQPKLGMIPAGMLISLAGMGIGFLCFRRSQRKRNGGNV